MLASVAWTALLPLGGGDATVSTLAVSANEQAVRSAPAATVLPNNFKNKIQESELAPFDSNQCRHSAVS